MAIDIQTPALSQAILPPRSPLRMQGSIAVLSVCATGASMDTCMCRHERSGGNGMFNQFVGGIRQMRNPPLPDFSEAGI